MQKGLPPAPRCSSSGQRDVRAAKLSPPRSMKSQPCAGKPQHRATKMGRGACIASGGENQQGLSPPGRWETQMPPFHKQALLLLQHQPGESTAQSPTDREPTLLYSDPEEGSAGYRWH